MNSALFVIAAAAQVFFPAADTKPTPFDGAAVRIENGAAVVDVVPNHKFCGVNFVFPKPVALNRYERLSTEISNRTDRTLDFVVHGIVKGTHRRFVQGKARLGPGESAVVMAPCCRRCYTMVTDGDGLPGMMGYDRKYRPDSLDQTGNISSIIVFSNLQESPAQFDVKRVWAEGEQPDRTLKIDDAFFPSVPALASVRYRFQGREWSAATGLVNFRMRWYDPVTGRWLSKDPIGLNGGLNLYAFCGNNPILYLDPYGEFWGLIIAGITSAVAVVWAAYKIIKRGYDAKRNMEKRTGLKDIVDGAVEECGKTLKSIASPFGAIPDSTSPITDPVGEGLVSPFIDPVVERIRPVR